MKSKKDDGDTMVTEQAASLCSALGCELVTGNFSSVGDRYPALMDYSCEGLFLMHHDWTRISLPESSNQVCSPTLLHELGHVIEFAQITNSDEKGRRPVFFYHHHSSRICQILGDSEFDYLGERVADYYALLLAALLLIYSEGRVDLLDLAISEFQQQESGQKSRMIEEFYLEDDPMDRLTKGFSKQHILYTARQLTTTEALFNHVNHHLKLETLVRFFGFKRELNYYYPYIRIYDDKAPAQMDVVQRLKNISSSLSLSPCAK